ETKKMIPRIKAELAARGIPLRTDYDRAHGRANQQLDLAAVLDDYRHGRVLGEKTIKAGFYYGREHAFFHRRYFLNRLPAAQYGFLVDTGRVELSFYATPGTRGHGLTDTRGK